MKHADYVVEYAKTFINLASLLLALSITFAGKTALADHSVVWLLLLAWVSWIGSVYYGAQAIREMVNVALASEEADTKNIARVAEPTSPATPEASAKSGTADDDDASVDIYETIFSPNLGLALTFQFWLFGFGFAFAVLVALRLGLS